MISANLPAEKKAADSAARLLRRDFAKEVNREILCFSRVIPDTPILGLIRPSEAHPTFGWFFG